jgi:acylpyruvate hydrolase
LAKGRDGFGPVSEFVPPERLSDPSAIDFLLEVNGTRRQKGNTREMIFSIPRIIAFLSRAFTLTPGDLIFTGTPSGVAPLKDGDRVRAVLGTDGAALATLEVTIARR